MKVALACQMQKIDQTAQEVLGISGATLMERAALAALEAIKADFKELAGKHIYIYCGKGNNGGDGLAIARLLLESGAKVTAVLVFQPEEYRGLARDQFVLALKYGVRLLHWSELEPIELEKADLIVDAILGTGSKGAPTGAVEQVIQTLNGLNKPVLAVDLPSGLDVDTGQVKTVAIRATHTITFGLPKPGLLCYPGAEYTGALAINSIGFPETLLQNPELFINYLTIPEAKAILPRRSATAHKGTTGHLLVVGGSTGMTGAVAIAALGALRTGAGLVTAGIRTDLPFPEKPMEAISLLWPEITEKLDRFDAIVFGPGLTTQNDGAVLLARLIKQAKVPLLIDADGLNLIALNKKLLQEMSQPAVLTPHPGEMSRLTGLTVAEIQGDRINIARRFATEWKVTLVLKGARTVIATPDGEIYLNLTGNPGMATAGMGDALAGIIGALIVQGLPVPTASIIGTYIHGLAGDLAVEGMGPIGIIVSDLLRKIPQALKKVLTQ